MYVGHYYCDKCGGTWKTFYRSYESLALGDACQVCTADEKWGTLEEVIVEPHFFEEVDEG